MVSKPFHYENWHIGSPLCIALIAEYATPAWCRSATHKETIDTTLNETLRITTGYLKPSPTDFLSLLSSVA